MDERENDIAPDAARDGLTPAARRALEEAEERRKARGRAGEERAAEVGGRRGPDPARYGDWEKDGVASDF